MEQEQARVFLLEPVKHNIEDVKDFGEVIYLFRYAESRPSIFSQEYQEELEKRFKKYTFNPELDYFVLTGFQITLALAVAVLTRVYKNFDLLAFYAPSYNYTVINVSEINNARIN